LNDIFTGKWGFNYSIFKYFSLGYFYFQYLQFDYLIYNGATIAV